MIRQGQQTTSEDWCRRCRTMVERDETRFSGKWSDLRNVPALPAGVSFPQYAREQLEMLGDIAENRFQNALAQSEYDAVLFDTFLDDSKIASSTGITLITGIDGAINPQDEVVDDFEDQDVSGYSMQSGSGGISVESSDPISGSYSATATEPGGGNTRIRSPDFGPTKTNLQIDVEDNNDIGPNIEGFNIKVFDPNGNQICVLRENQNTNIKLNGTQVGSGDLAQDSPETLLLEFDWANNQVTAYRDGGNATTVGFENAASEWQYFELFLDGSDGSSMSYTIDNITKVYGTTVQDGSFTTTEQDIGFTPSKAVVEHDAAVPSDGDLTYTVKDGNGNTVQVPLGDVGSEIDVSSFTDSTVLVEGDITAGSSEVPEIAEFGVRFV